MPFLFKVLSINKALSIQAHPNKKLAEQLHKSNPKEYKDDNHKPEMTIAVTPFEGLCGFRPLGEIAYHLKHIKALRSLVGDDAASKFEKVVSNSSPSEKEQKQALRDVFTALMESKQDLKSASEQLLKQVEQEQDRFPGGSDAPPPGGKGFKELIPRLNSQFPDDIGLFVTFFLNFVKMEEGEAMFLQADDIHAYISGDIIECMAASDNVVRAGFTPKFKVSRDGKHSEHD